MPYRHTEHLTVPHDGTTVWRYMDLPKFVALLQTSQLHLRRIDHLDDPYEGRPPDSYVHRSVLPSGLEEFMTPDMIEEYKKRIPAVNKRFVEMMRLRGYVNCWHMNEHESAAMWRLYGRDVCCVAITATVEDIKVALHAADEPVYIVQVTYLDYTVDEIPPGAFLEFYASKRRSFEHEREVRLLYYDADYSEAYEPGPLGIPISVDLKQLVQKLWLSPTSDGWMLDAVRRLCDQYGLGCRVDRSDLYEDPVY